MLARLGRDPWAEAARWTALPRAAVIDSLAETIAQMPLASPALAATRAIAVRLVQLLPAKAQDVPQRNAAETGIASAARRWLPILYCALALGLALNALLMPGQSPAPPSNLWAQPAAWWQDRHLNRPRQLLPAGLRSISHPRLASGAAACRKWRRAASLIAATVAPKNTVVPMSLGWRGQSPAPRHTARRCECAVQVMPRRANTGCFTTSSTTANTPAAASVVATTTAGSGVTANPPKRQGARVRHVNQGRRDQPPARAVAPQMRTAADRVDQYCRRAQCIRSACGSRRTRGPRCSRPGRRRDQRSCPRTRWLRST